MECVQLDMHNSLRLGAAPPIGSLSPSGAHQTKETHVQTSQMRRSMVAMWPRWGLLVALLTVAAMTLGAGASSAHTPSYTKWFLGDDGYGVTVSDNDWQLSPWSGTRYGGHVFSSTTPYDYNILRFTTANYDGIWPGSSTEGSSLHFHHASVWGRARCTGERKLGSQMSLSCEEFRSSP